MVVTSKTQSFECSRTEACLAESDANALWYPEINPLKPSREHEEPLPEGDQRREAGEGSGGELAPPCSRTVIRLTWLTKADVEYGFCKKWQG